MITQKVFSDKLVFYRDGEPIYGFKIRNQKKELRELMQEEQNRTGARDLFMKTQFDYSGTYAE